MSARRNIHTTMPTSTMPSSMLCDTVFERGVDQPGAVVERDDAHAGRQQAVVDESRPPRARRAAPAWGSHRAAGAPSPRPNRSPRRAPPPRAAACTPRPPWRRCAPGSASRPWPSRPSPRCRAACAGSRGRAPPAPPRPAAGSRPTRRRWTSPPPPIRSASVSPTSRSRTGSASTWYSFWKPPKLTTSATPGARISWRDTTQSCQLRSSLGECAVALQRVLVDLPDRRVVRSQVRRDAFGHVGVGQPLRHLLPRPVDVDVVLEGQDHLRQPERRDRPLHQHARRPGQRALDRDGDLLLDLLRRLAGVEGDHHDLDVRDVREGLDLQLGEGDAPKTASASVAASVIARL